MPDKQTVTTKPTYLPCPICKGVEGCDHTYPERERAATQTTLPALPDGFICMSLSFGKCRFTGNAKAHAFITDQISLDYNGDGDTPGEALQNAINKIRKADAHA
jgi:hypothetical protein